MGIETYCSMRPSEGISAAYLPYTGYVGPATRLAAGLPPKKSCQPAPFQEEVEPEAILPMGALDSKSPFERRFAAWAETDAAINDPRIINFVLKIKLSLRLARLGWHACNQ